MSVCCVFQDPSVQQASRGGGQRQAGLDDYNPFAEGNQTRPTAAVRIVALVTLDSLSYNGFARIKFGRSLLSFHHNWHNGYQQIKT